MERTEKRRPDNLQIFAMLKKESMYQLFWKELKAMDSIEYDSTSKSRIYG